jgi:hypothetical protein
VQIFAYIGGKRPIQRHSLLVHYTQQGNALYITFINEQLSSTNDKGEGQKEAAKIILKYTLCVIKSLEYLNNLKTGLKLTIHVIKSQIHLVRQSL